MPTIELQTRITAPIQRVFDLARSIDLHMETTGNTREVAISGRTSGLLDIHETVTWRATHLGVRQTLSVKMMAMDKPWSFRDEMLSGAFKFMRHTHRFTQEGSVTIMKDTFEYASPLGPIGQMVDFLFLKEYMHRFLLNKNKGLKEVAESDAWRAFL